MTGTIISVVLTAPELVALGQILGIPEVLLPVDPFRGWLVEEIEEAVSTAAGALASRKLFQVEGEKAWVDPGLAALAGLLAFPQMTIRIKAGLKTIFDKESVVYVRAEAWALLQSTEEGYSLHGGEDFLELDRLLRDRIVGSDPVSRRQPVFHIPESAVPALQAVWRGADPVSAGEALLKHGMPQRSVEILQRLLPGEETGSLMLERREAGRGTPTGGAVLVNHEDGMSMLLLDVRAGEAVWRAWSAPSFKSWLVHILAQILPED